ASCILFLSHSETDARVLSSPSAIVILLDVSKMKKRKGEMVIDHLGIIGSTPSFQSKWPGFGERCYFFNRHNLHSYYGDNGCHLTSEDYLGSVTAISLKTS
ncbi:hypothetical protein PFISCL1PPCAC_25275, partial [Pristionchus fissidentatus]